MPGRAHLRDGCAGPLEVRGVFGSIRAEGTADGTASLTAHKTATSSDPTAVNIRVVPFDGGVVICAMCPDGDDPKQPNTCNPTGSNFTSVSDTDVQVEFTIKVPAGVQLTARTLQGDIQALSLTADVSATTDMSDITISTSGDAQATALQGSIKAAIGSVAWRGVRFFETGMGNIDLQMPADASVSVFAHAFQGTVVSDFPLTTRTMWGSTFATGRLGKAGRTLLLSVNRGAITLRQGPASGQ